MLDVKCPLCDHTMEEVAKIGSTVMQCPGCCFVCVPNSTAKPLKLSYASEEKDNEYLAIAQRASMCIANASKSDHRIKVLDIGSRDGHLLGWYSKRVLTVGIESNVSLVKNSLNNKKADIALPMEFTSAEEVREAFGQIGVVIDKFRIITVVDILQDVVNPKYFLEQCKELLDEKGVLVIQVPYLPVTARGDKFVNCRNYFFVSTFKRLAEKIGLMIHGAEHNERNLRVYLGYPSFSSLFAASDYDEKLRLHVGISSSIVTLEVGGRYDQAVTYRKLEDSLTNKPKQRGAF